MFVPDPDRDFVPSRIPGPKRHRIPDPQHCWCGTEDTPMKFRALLQVILISTGNLSFLNWLTISPSLWYLDDRFLSPLFPRQLVQQVQVLQVEDNSGKQRTRLPRRILSAALCALLAYLSAPIVANLLSSRQIMNTSYDPLRIVNTYGAFGHVTKERTEVIFEGTESADPSLAETVWEEYEFHCKPGNVSRRPCLISPFHYRYSYLQVFRITMIVLIKAPSKHFCLLFPGWTGSCGLQRFKTTNRTRGCFTYKEGGKLKMFYISLFSHV